MDLYGTVGAELSPWKDTVKWMNPSDLYQGSQWPGIPGKHLSKQTEDGIISYHIKVRKILRLYCTSLSRSHQSAMVTWKSVVPHCCPFVARPHCARLLKDTPQAKSSFKRFQTFKKNLMKHHDATTETFLYHQHVWDAHAFSSTLEAFHPTIPGSLPKRDRAANPLCSKSWRFKANRLRLRVWKLWKRVANCPGILSKQIFNQWRRCCNVSAYKLW